MRPHRFLAALLAASLALSLGASASAAYYEAFEHPDVRYADMDASPIDLADVDAFCGRFARDPAGEYQALLDLYDAISTKLTLASIRSDRNAGDAAAGAAHAQASDDFDRAADRLCAALGEALASARGGALRALMPEGEADAFLGYGTAGAETPEGWTEETGLLREYLLLPDDASFPDRAAALYLRLAALRRREAGRMGFDSYPAYAYISSFAREYAPEDAARLHRIVKSRLAPLYVRCEQALAARAVPWDDADVPADAELLDAIAAHLGDISPELNEAMDFLRRNGLYCIGDDEAMYDAGHAYCLPAYRSAFLFNKVGARYDAFETTVHEFGHFNAAYHDPTPALYQYGGIDLSELQSQGLEALFLPALQDILAGDDAGGRALVELRVLTDLLCSVVEGCLYDEFEQAAYAGEALSMEELRALEARLNREYGLDALYGDEARWPYVRHLFDQPCYYISYAVSALPALDLWLLSRRDRGAAADAYMKISAARTDAWFLDVLYDNGLCDVTDRGDVARLADALEAQLGALAEELPAQRARAAGWLAAGAIAALGGLWHAIRRKRSGMAPEREMDRTDALGGNEKTE